MADLKNLLARRIVDVAASTKTGLMPPHRCDGHSPAMRVNDDMLPDRLLQYQLTGGGTVSAWPGTSDAACGGGETP